MENKKSKVKYEEGEEEEEETKMEKFYSLLRSYREARDRRRKQLDELEKNDKKKRKKKLTEQETTSSSWVPSFEREDFTTEVVFRRPPLVLPAPIERSSKANKKEPHKDDALDLKLAL
ncbi:hypothetical protein L6164_034817 [Bauhinia variegata]|uniref:Uncharacterized protein n=1 Tax=Bauhinia variegata TaxID=167791 RepID=A0ACB9KVR2_BAUVA|nr:hypothetical protein L6164_034817 [Bauhinia variegata]